MTIHAMLLDALTDEELSEMDALTAADELEDQAARDNAMIARILDRSTPGSLAAFVRYSWPMVEPGRPFLESWHIDVICAAIEEHFDDPESGGELVCCQPPRTMKSYIFNVIFPAWAWPPPTPQSINGQSLTATKIRASSLKGSFRRC
jgi:hypothetical protein